jgi:AcrR family transcriptional regulator
VRPSSSTGGRRRRVAALTPDERRAAIVAATLPLLRECGLSVSTRQIAEACGVAEGTIFGVFPDKPALIEAAMVSAFDPEPVVRSFTAIDRAAELRHRLAAAARILVERLAANERLIAAVRGANMAPDSVFLAQLADSRRRILEAITEVIEPDRARLRRSPTDAAQLLLVMVFATARGMFGENTAIDGDEIVALLLDGLLLPSSDHARPRHPEPRHPEPRHPEPRHPEPRHPEPRHPEPGDPA